MLDMPSRQITDLNLYGTSSSTNNLFYVDNLLYYENNLNCTCTNEYDPYIALLVRNIPTYALPDVQDILKMNGLKDHVVVVEPG